MSLLSRVKAEAAKPIVPPWDGYQAVRLTDPVLRDVEDLMALPDVYACDFWDRVFALMDRIDAAHIKHDMPELIESARLLRQFIADVKE